MKSTSIKTEHKAFLDIFKQLCTKRQSWEAWADFVHMTAASISNITDRAQADEREKRWVQIAAKYDEAEMKIFQQLFGATVDALERSPDQDFLGDLYMSLELGSHWHGQFFTPYSICRLVADMNVDNAIKKAEENGWISVCDPACGAGALLVAFASSMRSRGTNYQQHVLFVGQDIDSVAAHMCYIQLSLLGCPGYIAIGDTLRNPLTGSLLLPEKKDGLDVWYTPMYFSDIWAGRRAIDIIKSGPLGTFGRRT